MPTMIPTTTRAVPSFQAHTWEHYYANLSDNDASDQAMHSLSNLVAPWKSTEECIRDLCNEEERDVVFLTLSDVEMDPKTDDVVFIHQWNKLGRARLGQRQTFASLVNFGTNAPAAVLDPRNGLLDNHHYQVPRKELLMQMKNISDLDLFGDESGSFDEEREFEDTTLKGLLPLPPFLLIPMMRATNKTAGNLFFVALSAIQTFDKTLHQSVGNHQQGGAVPNARDSCLPVLQALWLMHIGKFMNSSQLHVLRVATNAMVIKWQRETHQYKLFRSYKQTPRSINPVSSPVFSPSPPLLPPHLLPPPFSSGVVTCKPAKEDHKRKRSDDNDVIGDDLVAVVDNDNITVSDHDGSDYREDGRDGDNYDLAAVAVDDDDDNITVSDNDDSDYDEGGGKAHTTKALTKARDSDKDQAEIFEKDNGLDNNQNLKSTKAQPEDSTKVEVSEKDKGSTNQSRKSSSSSTNKKRKRRSKSGRRSLSGQVLLESDVTGKICCRAKIFDEKTGGWRMCEKTPVIFGEPKCHGMKCQSCMTFRLHHRRVYMRNLRLSRKSKDKKEAIKDDDEDDMREAHIS